MKHNIETKTTITLELTEDEFFDIWNGVWYLSENPAANYSSYEWERAKRATDKLTPVYDKLTQFASHNRELKED